ncbi:MAG: uracil-DNA glycosylase family protein [Hyphomicrobiales bacterium]|nr:uracil-DNA glycosylase family protein [Hyphomicrobiales bacterium]
MDDVDRLSAEIAACRICRDAPLGRPLPHEPRPIFRISPTARICIASQAPGLRAHASGVPFSDPSGKRLRAWMGVSEAVFYDAAKIAITPMGFCFPGYDAQGGDLPPRKECAITWRGRLFTTLPYFKLTLLVGRHAQAWHLGKAAPGVSPQGALGYDEEIHRPGLGRVIGLPHPSWRNNGWLKRNPWFEERVTPMLRMLIDDILSA